MKNSENNIRFRCKKQKKVAPSIFLAVLICFFTSCSDNSTLDSVSDMEDNSDNVIPIPDNDMFDFAVNSDQPEIESAIAHTLGIWSEYLETNVTIRVNVVFLPDLGGFLGRSIPNGVKNFEGAPLQDTWYPLSLANALVGENLKDNEFDMDILINSNTDWYFGIDGNPGTGQYDFVTALLHEVCHSLGFGSLAGRNENLGIFGDFQADDGYIPSFPVPDLEVLPSVYDTYLITGQMEVLSDSELFPNNSVALADAFTSDDLFFSGNGASLENSGQEPKLFAPSIFLDGSSISHLDQGSFETGNPNRLMEPFFIEQEVIHEPGQLILAFLRDIGWTIVSPNG